MTEPRAPRPRRPGGRGRRAARRGGARAAATIVLTGGSTPRRAPTSTRRRSSPTGARPRSGGATSAACRPTTSSRTTGSPKRRCSTGSRRQPEVHRIRGELQPADAAGEYEQRSSTASTLDLLLLGLGPDGHVASLFPGSPQLAERERRVTSGEAGLEPFVDRVTMTLPTLLSAAGSSFLVAGAGKAEAVERAFRRRDQRGRAGEPAPRRARRRSTSTSTPPRGRPTGARPEDRRGPQLAASPARCARAPAAPARCRRRRRPRGTRRAPRTTRAPPRPPRA